MPPLQLPRRHRLTRPLDPAAPPTLAPPPLLPSQEFGHEYCCTEEHHSRRLLFGSQPHMGDEHDPSRHCASYDCAWWDTNLGR